jgi:nitrilase
MIRVAVVQAGSVLFDTPATMHKLRRFSAEAASRGTRLAVFPEAFVGGYPKGIDFGARVGSRSPEGREWFRRYYESAISAPGPEVAAIGEITMEHRMHVVVGVIERDGGTSFLRRFRRQHAMPPRRSAAKRMSGRSRWAALATWSR